MNLKNTVLATLILPDGKVDLVSLPNDEVSRLQKIQELVGGYVESIAISGDRRMFMNESAKEFEHTMNHAATAIAHESKTIGPWDYVAGVAVILPVESPQISEIQEASPSLIVIANRGQAIASTNYWDSEYAQAGLCFLSWNAGAARLLLPRSLNEAIREMRTAKYVIISRGPSSEHGGRDALELLFEDKSDSPYCIQLAAEQVDRMLPASEQGSGFVFTVWTKGGEKLRLNGKYRTVDSLPCLSPWASQ